MNHTTFDDIYKIIIVGDANVGKSNLLSCFINNKTNDNYHPTIGIDFYIKEYKNQNNIIRLHIWDTAGQERYYSIIKQYYRDVIGAIIIYDITDSKSFENINKWYNDLILSNDNIKIILIGNKLDLIDDRIISFELGQKFAKYHNILFMETSALSCNNINDAFELLIKDICADNIINNKDNVNIKRKSSNYIRLSDNKTKTSICSCQIL